MFETLRRMIFPIIIIVLLFFTAMIVLQWGMGFSQKNDFANSNVAAVINGEEISWQEYNQIYNNLYQNESQNSEEELPDSKIQELQMNAWNQLLHDRLVMQQIPKYNITVNDEELYAFLKLTPPADLQQLPYFQTNGKFDYQKYINTMTDPNAASFWASLEPIIKNEILKLKLQEIVIQTAHVTENEIKEFYMGSNEKIKVGMINVPFERFSRPPPKSTDEELLEYYNEHKEDYPIKERASLNIVMVEKKPEPYDWEILYNQAKAIYDSIEAGSDFAEMAKTYSADGSAENGGDLGWFPKGQMVPEFDKQVFSMVEGDICEPLRTQFGWHIIKVHEFKEEMDIPRGKKEKEKVRKVHASHILVKVSLSQETIDKAYSRIEEFHSAALKKGFFKAAEDLEMSVRKTGLFFRGRNIQYIGNDPNAGLFAFDNEVDEISEVLENNSAIFVVQVAEKKPEGMANFEEVKDKLGIDIVKYKVETLCRDTANAIYAEIQSGASLKAAAKKYGEEYTVLDPFKRGSYVKEIGQSPQAIGAAFSLTEPGQITEPIDHNQGCVIFKLIERSTLDLSEFTAKRDSIYKAIMISKQQELYGRWFNNLIENSEIVNNIQKSLQSSDI